MNFFARIARKVKSLMTGFGMPEKDGTPTLVRRGSARDLYAMKYGNMWLDKAHYLDREIIEHGVFEPASTAVVEKLVKVGDVVLDVGANIGYYAVMFSKLVGPEGQVLAFEPTKHFGDVLRENLEANNLSNCETHSCALSDRIGYSEISIGESSATMQWSSDLRPFSSERIALTTLDRFVEEHALKKIDFVKVDVDGHEPLFLKGAEKTITKFSPIILLEISHEHYLKVGVTAWDFYEDLKMQGFHIYSERGLREYSSKRDFLLECGNFAYSANIIISKKPLSRFAVREK